MRRRFRFPMAPMGKSSAAFYADRGEEMQVDLEDQVYVLDTGGNVLELERMTVVLQRAGAVLAGDLPDDANRVVPAELEAIPRDEEPVRLLHPDAAPQSFIGGAVSYQGKSYPVERGIVATRDLALVRHLVTKGWQVQNANVLERARAANMTATLEKLLARMEESGVFSPEEVAAQRAQCASEPRIDLQVASERLEQEIEHRKQLRAAREVGGTAEVPGLEGGIPGAPTPPTVTAEARRARVDELMAVARDEHVLKGGELRSIESQLQHLTDADLMGPLAEDRLLAEIGERGAGKSTAPVSALFADRFEVLGEAKPGEPGEPAKE